MKLHFQSLVLQTFVVIL